MKGRMGGRFDGIVFPIGTGAEINRNGMRDFILKGLVEVLLGIDEVKDCLDCVMGKRNFG